MRINKVLILSAVALATAATAGLAAPRKEGNYSARNCFHGPAHVNVLSNEVMAGSYGLTALATAPEADVWYGVSGTCNGAWQLLGGVLTEMGSCDYVDKDGDHFFGIYTRTNMDGKWKVHGGTGKFRGMEQAGIWAPAEGYTQVNGEFRGCSTISGYWKLK